MQDIINAVYLKLKAEVNLVVRVIFGLSELEIRFP